MYSFKILNLFFTSYKLRDYFLYFLYDMLYFQMNMSLILIFIKHSLSSLQTSKHLIQVFIECCYDNVKPFFLSSLAADYMYPGNVSSKTFSLLYNIIYIFWMSITGSNVFPTKWY